jgi:adenylylsulfate kinase
MKVLFLGLPGSGKTTLAEEVAEMLDAVHINADAVREEYNDWDFTTEGRMRQAMRMQFLSDGAIKAGRTAVTDFVCPTPEARAQFGADFTIWMDTIEEGRFEDTNKVFQAPESYDLRITEWSDENPSLVFDAIQDKIWCSDSFDWQKPTTQMLGRWQPWHDGHTALFKEALALTGQVAIMVRDVGGVVGEDAGGGRTETQDDNPFEWDAVCDNIEVGLAAAGYLRDVDYVIMQVPNIVDISYGRGVGYTFTQHDLGANIHDISATKIRNAMREEGEL